MSTIQLKVDKRYRCRNGEVVAIGGFMSGLDFPFWAECKDNVTRIWTRGGLYLGGDVDPAHAWDIVEELPDDSNEHCLTNGDTIEDLVIRKIRERRERGINKYGVSMERDDLSLIDWLTHAQEEAMDLAVYLEKIICTLKEQSTNQ